MTTQVQCDKSRDGLHSTSWYDRIGPCADCGEDLEKPQPRLHMPLTVDWYYDPVQHSVFMRCVDCGVSARRTWADEHSTAPQEWAANHVCGEPERGILHFPDGSSRRA